QKGIRYEVVIDVYNARGMLKYNDRFLFTEPEGVAEEIALRIFGKKGAVELEAPAPTTTAKR
nr:hypothetical protein [Chitinophagaceae bacterium]